MSVDACGCDNHRERYWPFLGAMFASLLLVGLHIAILQD
jgi:hypothetical protein